MRAVQAAIYMPRHAKSFGNSSVPISQNEEPFRTEYLYTAISRKFVGKSARENSRKALWVVLSSMFFKEI